MNDFSYAYYLHLIKTILQSVPLVDFANIKPTDDSFFILRHDVEFSVEKAYEMAKIEHDSLGVKSSYFFQIRNYTYNVLAFKNIELIKKIQAMGHSIGLHANTGGLTNIMDIIALVKQDVAILQRVLDMPVDRFSFHRPSHDVLKQNIKIEGLINAYDPLFFHFYNHEPPQCLNVHYFSDSEHQWKYGNPLSVLGFPERLRPAASPRDPRILLNAKAYCTEMDRTGSRGLAAGRRDLNCQRALDKPVKKIHLLVHPYSWSKQGLDNTRNFKALIQLKQAQMLQSMQNECRKFPNELLLNEKI